MPGFGWTLNCSDKKKLDTAPLHSTNSHLRRANTLEVTFQVLLREPGLSIKMVNLVIEEVLSFSVEPACASLRDDIKFHMASINMGI